MSVSCNDFVLYSTILPCISWIQSASSFSFPRSVFFHPFRNWPVLTWATEHRMVASFFFKAGYVENLRWTVAGESVVMFHHASTEEFGGPTAEVYLAFAEPFC